MGEISWVAVTTKKFDQSPKKQKPTASNLRVRTKIIIQITLGLVLHYCGTHYFYKVLAVKARKFMSRDFLVYVSTPLANSSEGESRTESLMRPTPVHRSACQKPQIHQQGGIPSERASDQLHRLIYSKIFYRRRLQHRTISFLEKENATDPKIQTKQIGPWETTTLQDHTDQHRHTDCRNLDSSAHLVYSISTSQPQ